MSDIDTYIKNIDKSIEMLKQEKKIMLKHKKWRK